MLSFPRLLAVMICLAVGGCQMALPGGAGGGSAAPLAEGGLGEPEVIQSGPIAATALPDPVAAAAPAAAAVPEAAAAPAAATGPGSSPPPQRSAKASAAAKAEPAAAGAAAAAAPAAAAPAPDPVPAAIQGQKKTCERKGGRFAKHEKAGWVCFVTPGDAGKSCRRSTDCEGACLAKSGTCAPVIPLYGCHEIFTREGARVTQCIN